MAAPRRLAAQRLLALARAAQLSGSAPASASATATSATAGAWAAATTTTTTTAPAATAARAMTMMMMMTTAKSTPAAPFLLPLAARPFAAAASARAFAAKSSSRAPAAARSSLHTSSRAAAAAEAAAPKNTKNETPWGQKSPLSFNSMIAGLAVFLGVVAFAQGTADKRVGDMMQKSQQVAGKAAVGGPFRLVDARGKPFTNRDLLGEFALLYFGFTHCPDICPDELEKVAEAVDAVERETGAKVVPVFISVDPRRDTPARVAAYVREFHPRMVGLTGSEQAVTDAAKAYRVYFSRTDGGGGSGSAAGSAGGVTNPSSSSSAQENNDDYLVDHSIITYLIDPSGEFVTFYGKNFDAEQLGASIKGHVMAWAEKDEGYLSRLSCKLPGAAAANAEGEGASEEEKKKK